MYIYIYMGYECNTNVIEISSRQTRQTSLVKIRTDSPTAKFKIALTTHPIIHCGTNTWEGPCYFFGSG